MRIAAITALALTLVFPALSAEPALTRTAEAGAPRPKATLAELDWLTGTWSGPGVENAPSTEHWSPPIGGAKAGYFIQTDAKGGTMFSEYMQIVPDGASLKVRLKHFNDDLTGWEDKAKTVDFPLIAREPGAFYFNGLTYRRDGANRLLVAVRMKHDDGKTSELVFRFRRVK